MAKEYHQATPETIPIASENRPVIGHGSPHGHYSAESGDWDGQLPHAELVHSAKPQYPSYPGPVDRRKWATNIGIAFDLSGTERSILQYYAHHAGTPQGCWKSADTMAYELGYHERSIRDAREKFIQLAILKDQGRRNRARRLTLNFDITGSEARLEENVTGSDTRLQSVNAGGKPGLTPGYDNQTGPEARSKPGVRPGKLKESKNRERDNNISLSISSISTYSSPGLTPGFHSRSPTSEEDQIESLIKENWSLLQETGWGYLGGAIKHYKKFGLEYLQEGLEQKRQEVEQANLTCRTCVHCRTVHDNADQVQPCPLCEDPICVSRLNSCRQNSCQRKQRAQKGKVTERRPQWATGTGKGQR